MGEAVREAERAIGDLGMVALPLLSNTAGRGAGAGFGVIAGSPETIREYMEEYVSTGANYFVASFQWGSLTHEQTMRSLELFSTEIMPHYMDTPVTGTAV